MIMTRDKILALLKSESVFLSGEEISKCLGLSRMAVSAAVKSLRAEGYDITSISNRGYKLNNCPDKLGWGDIVPYLFLSNDGTPHQENFLRKEHISDNPEDENYTYNYEEIDKIARLRQARQKTHFEETALTSRHNNPCPNQNNKEIVSIVKPNGMREADFFTGNIICLDSVDSTNNYLKKLSLEKRLPDGTVVIANEQTKGRGRLGRSFNSAKDVGIYMSMLVRPACGPADTVTITAQAACAVHKAIRNVFGIDAEIKWVNDLLLGGKKICGILTEMSAESDTGRIDYLIIGIGINVNNGEDDFPEEIKDIATSIKIYKDKLHENTNCDDSNAPSPAGNVPVQTNLVSEEKYIKSSVAFEETDIELNTESSLTGENLLRTNSASGKKPAEQQKTPSDETRYNRARLAAEIIKELDILREGFPAKSAEYLEYYRAQCTTIGKRVRADAPKPGNFAKKNNLSGTIDSAGESTSSGTNDSAGTVLAINENFSLKIKFDDGSVRDLFSGEVEVEK